MKFRLVICAFAVLVAPRVLFAQTVVSPGSLFAVAASPDDTATSGGVPVVTGYRLDVYQQGTTTSIFNRSIDKATVSATPCAIGTVTIPAPCFQSGIGWTAAQFAAIAPGNYVLGLTTIGQGGLEVPGPLSDPFVVPKTPRPAGKANVK